jgi:hypothetical protein
MKLIFLYLSAQFNLQAASDKEKNELSDKNYVTF